MQSTPIKSLDISDCKFDILKIESLYIIKNLTEFQKDLFMQDK